MSPPPRPYLAHPSPTPRHMYSVLIRPRDVNHLALKRLDLRIRRQGLGFRVWGLVTDLSGERRDRLRRLLGGGGGDVFAYTWRRIELI
jgi:hypothetical protein